MDSPDENPVPPANPVLTWRSLQPVDVGAIKTLATLCMATDGGHPLGATDTYVQEHYLPTQPGVTIGAFEKGGELVACAAVQPNHTSEEYRTNIVGQVHPAYRKRGVGTYLLEWSIAEASRLLASCPPDRPHFIQLTTEALSESADRLFGQHGFKKQFAEDVMRCDLPDPLPDVHLPSGTRLMMWAPALAGRFFAVYQAAFRERPGYPDWSREEWLAWLATDDDEFRPELSLLACHDDLPVGFIVSADRWIVQLGVRPEWRGRGIGSSLLIEVLNRFRAGGVEHVLLDVNVNNPRAARVYAGLGFERIGRRARYVRVTT